MKKRKKTEKVYLIATKISNFSGECLVLENVDKW